MTSHSSVPSPIKALVEIFDQVLGDVEFPGINASLLSAQAEALQGAAEALAAAESQFERARAAHARARDELALSADRALAYARVYASDDEELSATLAAIPLGRRGKRPPQPTKRRAKRAPPRAQDLTELPFAKTKGGRATTGAA